MRDSLTDNRQSGVCFYGSYFGTNPQFRFPNLNMESTSIASLHSCYCYPVPNRFFSRHPHVRLHRTRKIDPRVKSHRTNYCVNEVQQKKQNREESGELFEGLSSYIGNPQPRLREGEEEQEIGVDNSWSILSNMGLGDLKAALGQRINLQGIAHAIRILSKDSKLVIPHVSVPDIRHVNWVELKNCGFQGVVFDKDNTITVPYSLSLWSPLESSIQECKSVFGNNLAIFSNSAGLYEYDPDGKKAGALEDAIGINVIRHCKFLLKILGVKKPSGTADEIERHFGCDSSQLIMVGDRPFTDIVYGNRNGFFTVLTEPLSCAEPLIVRQVRLLEMAILKRWLKQGLTQTPHELVSDPKKCVKDATQMS